MRECEQIRRPPAAVDDDDRDGRVVSGALKHGAYRVAPPLHDQADHGRAVRLGAPPSKQTSLKAISNASLTRRKDNNDDPYSLLRADNTQATHKLKKQYKCKNSSVHSQQRVTLTNS